MNMAIYNMENEADERFDTVFDTLDHVQVRMRVRDKHVHQLQGLFERRSQLRALVLGKQLSNALSSGSAASSSDSVAASAMGIAAMSSCEQIAFNVAQPRPPAMPSTKCQT